MKEVVAIIRSERLREVCEAVEKAGHRGLVVTEIQGRGKEKLPQESWKGERYEAFFYPKAMVQIVAKDKDVAGLLDAIRKAARTGLVGDGMVYVRPVDNAYGVRMDEQGEEML